MISSWFAKTRLLILILSTSLLVACVDVEDDEDGDSGNNNSAPSITGTPASTVAVGSAYLFAPTATDSDVDDILTFTISNSPDWANFSTVSGVLSGIPAESNVGTASNIIISVYDGTDTTALPPFTITVTGNTSPVAVDDNVVGTEDNASLIAVLSNDTDADGNTLSILSITQPTNGGASISGTSVSYTPNADYFGTDMFTYITTDGMGGTATATVTIVITPVNDTPIAVPDSASTTQGNGVTINLLDNDSGLGDGSIVVTITSSTSDGTLLNNSDGTVHYTPNTEFTGTDAFIYQIEDADNQTATANGSIEVTCGSACPEGSRTVQLSWDPSLSADVVSYNVYYGTATGSYTDVMMVTSGTSYNYVTALKGMQYFAITAVTSDGNESDYSAEVSVDI